MSTYNIKKTLITFSVTWLVSFGCVAIFASTHPAPGRDTRAYDHKTVNDSLDSHPASNGTWRIAADLGATAEAKERIGTTQSPLRIQDSTGNWVGDAYKVHSGGRYIGLVIVRDKADETGDVSSEFHRQAWPLDRPAGEFALSDLDSPLVEPQFRLVQEEGRFFLMASVGLREFDLGSVHLTENPRASVGRPTRISASARNSAVSASTADCTLEPGDYDFCLVCGPCSQGEGDCDSDSECNAGLVCENDNGLEHGLDPFVDVCVDAQSSCPVDKGHYDYCALCGPCEEGEGDCDSDTDCAGDLICLDDVGTAFNWWWNVDVCVSEEFACPLRPGDEDYCITCGPCIEEEGDCDADEECSEGLSCVDDIGSSYGYLSHVDVCITVDAEECPVDDGSFDYCVLCGPCEAKQADCDGDEECGAGLICVNNAGGLYGFTSQADVCLAPIDSDSGEECPVTEGHYDFCTLCGPCEENVGDCDSDQECAGDLICLSDVGDFHGWRSDVDVCRVQGATDCPVPEGDPVFCDVCGPCAEGEGDCDEHSDCRSGLLCVANVGADYGFPADVDVCSAECPLSLGDPDYCRICGPCKEGQGDCDSDDECEGTAVSCLDDVGEFFGWAPNVDVCVGSGTCSQALGSETYCEICGPCEEGEGDCDFDFDCDVGLFCSDTAADYGLPSDIQVCVPRSEEECAELLGSPEYCDLCGPCEEGEGDCDTSADCIEGLICTNNVGDEYGFESTIDVCQFYSVDDCDQLHGDWDFCFLCGPCDEGEGDCDSNEECLPGLICSDNVGEDYGFESSVDVCVTNTTCEEPNGTNDYCSVCGPCGEGQGDCDGDQECQDGLICVNNIGADFGWNWEVDVCMSGSAQCPVEPGHYDYCSLCGPCEKGEGDCDGDEECQDGLVCVNNVGVLYSWPGDVDVCEEQPLE